MAYRSHAAKQVADAAPPNPRVAGYGVVMAYGGRKCGVYILAPFQIVVIGRITETGMQPVLQMVVSVDEAGQHEKPIEIDHGLSRIRRSLVIRFVNASDLAAYGFQVCPLARTGSGSQPSSADYCRGSGFAKLRVPRDLYRPHR